jgi:hypothetical protein
MPSPFAHAQTMISLNPDTFVAIEFLTFSAFTCEALFALGAASLMYRKKFDWAVLCSMA